MNTKYILLSLVVLLTACSESEDILQNPEKAQLTISTEIVTTRAFSTGLQSDIEFKEGNAIGFYLFNKYGDDYSRYTNETTAWNRKAVYRNSGWVLEEAMTLTDVQAKVVAYYPYKEGSASKMIQYTRAPSWLRVNQIIADIDIASYPHYDGQQDYLWGESTDSVDRYHPNARIQFKHVLPRITFEVQKSSDNATDNIYLRHAILKNSADNDNTICTTGELYENGQVNKVGATGQSITNGYTAPVLLNKGEVRTFDFLVLPTEVAEGSAVLRIEVRKGSTGQFQYHDISIPATKWESGKQYTYPVVVNIGGEQQQEINPGEKVYMGFNGDNGKPLYWSSCNLGASKPEDYGGLYGWGDPTGEHKEHYYKYKKDDPYYMTDTQKCLSYYGGNNPPSNISGTSYDVARQKLGGNWRIPTRSEFNLLDNNCTCAWTTRNGVKGMLFTSKINNNTIFMPYSPSRYGNYLYFSGYNTVSGTYYEGMDYWCANLNSTNPDRASMFVLNNDNSCWIGSGNYRYAGLSIRPVTE